MQISFRLPAIFGLISVFLLFSGSRMELVAQSQKGGLDTIAFSSVILSRDISANTGIYIDTNNTFRAQSFANLPKLYFIPKSLGRKLQARYIGKSIFLQFSVKNDTDTAASLYFLPGFYCNSLHLFKQDKVTRQFGPIEFSDSQDSGRANIVCCLDLAAGETATYITEISFIKTTVNTITPTLVQENFLPSLYTRLQNERHLNSIITYLVCGIMLMMIIYSFAGFYTSRRMEFIYYATYAFLLGIMFFGKAFLYKVPTPLNFTFESYFDFILQASGTLFYFIFLRTFINSEKEYPVMDKVLYAQQVITAVGMALFTILNFFSDNFPLQNQVENLVKYAWSASTLIFIGFAIYTKSYLLRYLAIGHAFLVFFGFLSLYLINTPNRFNGLLTALVNDSLFWYELGVMFELVFFMMALSIKNKLEISTRAREKERLLMDYEKSAIERKMEILAAQQDERNRISADMHDELGSGVTAIRLMSELAKAKMKENTPSEIDKISNSANDLITKMNTIIWTMKSSNDTVDNMIAYVRAYASEFLDNTNLKYKITYPELINPIELSGEKRQNIFLCIKESLNNIAKHANATEVQISFVIGPQLVIRIADNGVGLNPDRMREFSNGLVNMRKRMETIDGEFEIRKENGTTVILAIPLTSQ